MVDGVKGSKFKRGLDDAFMDKLDMLRSSGWFAEVLVDKDLILGIRNNYLDVYRYGQRLFHIVWAGKAQPLKVTTHPKYLVDPDLSRPVVFDGERFAIADTTALMGRYEGKETLAKMKRAAKYYAGEEKMGVHRITRENQDVIDVEIAFVREPEEDEQQEKKKHDRIDIACLEKLDDQIHLRFWEAKHNSNGDLRAAGDRKAKVVEQIKRYQRVLAAHRPTILDSYKAVAGNLAKIASWTNGARKLGPLLREIANRGALVDEVPQVGLIVFGYEDAHRKDVIWKRHMKKLKDEGFPLNCSGNPESIRV